MLTLLLIAAACGDDDENTSSPNDTGEASAEPVTLRLGYFPNVTHTPAILGVENGFVEDALGDNVTLETSNFNAGTEAIEALFSGAIDASFIGPNPAINAFAQERDSVRIVAGSTSAGASLVVKPEITDAEDLRGKTLATPSLGNTQDVALRAWLAESGLETDEAGGGDVYPAAGQRRHARCLPGGHDRRRLGPGAVGHPAATRRRRGGPGRRGRPLAGRRVRHHPLDRGDRVPTRTILAS